MIDGLISKTRHIAESVFTMYDLAIVMQNSSITLDLSERSVRDAVHALRCIVPYLPWQLISRWRLGGKTGRGDSETHSGNLRD